MCIIVAKPSGIKLPTTETLDNCYTSNKNGIGIAYNLPGEYPHIAKGYFSVPQLEKIMRERGICEDHNLIIHFRFATHGKVDKGNCHPFPLTNNYEDMRLLNCQSSCAIAHNGVFSGMPANKNHSDTMKFIGGILASSEIIENLEKQSVRELIRGYCGFSSKLAFLKSTGLSLIGDFEKSEGIHYSNKQFESWGYKPSRNTSRKWNNDTQSFDEQKNIWSDTAYEWSKDHMCFIEKSTGKKMRRTYNYQTKDWDYLPEPDNNCCSASTVPITVKDGIGEKILNLDFKPVDKSHPCLWCTIVDKTVKWREEADGYLCDNCEAYLSTNDFGKSHYRD